MYELTLVRSVFQVTDRAVAGRAVSTTYLNVGVSRQVMPNALDFAWRCMSRQSGNLARSKLRINLVSAIITCEECGVDTPVDDNLVFVCAICNSTHYHVKTGEEFILTETDVS